MLCDGSKYQFIILEKFIIEHDKLSYLVKVDNTANHKNEPIFWQTYNCQR